MSVPSKQVMTKKYSWPQPERSRDTQENHLSQPTRLNGGWVEQTSARRSWYTYGHAPYTVFIANGKKIHINLNNDVGRWGIDKGEFRQTRP
jgi:hypothetical protein